MQKRVAVIIANGSEEIEAITPIDVFRRTDAVCDIVSVAELTVTCSHNVKVRADKLIGEVSLSDYDAIVIPGGMPGATNIANCRHVIDGLKVAITKGKVVGAICASPAVVLACNGLLDGVKATCYPAPDFIKMMEKSVYTATDVEVDKNVITANGPRSALAFSLELCKRLGLTPKF